MAPLFIGQRTNGYTQHNGQQHKYNPTEIGQVGDQEWKTYGQKNHGEDDGEFKTFVG